MPGRAPQIRDTNPEGKYTVLTPDVLTKEWGMNWETVKSAKERKRVDLSGDKVHRSGSMFRLETLEGPEGGLMHPNIHRKYIEILNISKNKLYNIDCLSSRRNGQPEFSNLQILNASRNMITSITISIPSLTELNLAHNELVDMPDFSGCPRLHKLIISHNSIEGYLDQFADMGKLTILDLSHNKFSWRPSVFKRQLDELRRTQIQNLKLWPNPFAEHFTEYQFLTVTELETITEMDGFLIAPELRVELRIQADKWRAAFDFTVFDIKVEDRKKQSGPIMSTGGEVADGTAVPCMADLTATLSQALDHPNELPKHMYRFEELVQGVWTARFPERQRLMEHRNLDVKEFEVADRPLRPEEQEREVIEFADKMEQVLERFDSVQDVLVMCLVRLLACGNELLSHSCADLLGDWIDSSVPHFQGRINDVSFALFRDLRLRTLAGSYSINENPFACYEASNGRLEELRRMVGNGDWGPAEGVAECACIWSALSRFGGNQAHSKATSPFRALVLRPFLPVLCKDARATQGALEPSDDWSKYTDFDSFPSEFVEEAEAHGTADNTAVFKERCIRDQYGGFVVTEDVPGTVRVMFKKQYPFTLVSLRNKSPGKTLYVRRYTSPAAGGDPEADQQSYNSWRAWVGSLSVLVAATVDPHNAARAVKDYEVHKVLHEHNTGAGGFADAWMLVTEEASRAFVLELQLAVNLMHAAGDAGHEAVEYFVEKKLHISCWSRAHRRLMEGGRVIPPQRLNEMDTGFQALVSWLLTAVCVMVQMSAGKEYKATIVRDVTNTTMDIFDAVTQVAASTSAPDPLLMASALEVLEVFIDSDISRPLILPQTLSRLHDSAILLPYVRGPKVEDLNNIKFQDLWRICEVKYPRPGTCVRDRMPELWLSAHGTQEERNQWRTRVPELKDLQNPLMHRVLLAIVKLIERFSQKAATDSSGLLKNVTDSLDRAGREELLIGPASGLVTCPDYDVKIGCMRCIMQVLQTSAEQFEMLEMGWLLRYLTSAGIGVAKQDDFLREVLELVTLLTQNSTRTGAIFREKFGKSAIRESFEMLRVNCRRPVAVTSEEAESKVKLSLKLVQMLQCCSRPLSGGLRRFIRRADFLSSLNEVIALQDKQQDTGCQAQLLRTWTGRDMREVLLPLATGMDISYHGVSRLLVIVRTADVLQGKNDCDKQGHDVESTDEGEFWPCLARMWKEACGQDAEELDDWDEQQDEFISADGFCRLVDFLEKVLRRDNFAQGFSKATSAVLEFQAAAEKNLKQWWGSKAVRLQEKPAQRRQAARDGAESAGNLEECFSIRLRSANNKVVDLFSYNLISFDEATNSSSLSKLANIFADFFTKNQEHQRRQREEFSGAYRELLAMPNQYFASGVLASIAELKQRGLTLVKARQPTGDLKRLLHHANIGQKALKQALLAGTADFEDKQSQKWARTKIDDSLDIDRTVSTGLTEFLRKYHAKVTDPGTLELEFIENLHKYKLFGDNTRLRNIVRLIIEYPDVEKLLNSLKEIRGTRRFVVKRIRNLFKHPSTLARRMVILTVELELEDTKHLGELQLVARDSERMDSYEAMSTLMSKLENSLRQDCKVREGDTSAIAQYLVHQMASRSIRHGDGVFLKVPAGNLEVERESVFVQSSNLNNGQLLYIEREQGLGVVRSGDIVLLKSKATKNYIDVSTSQKVQCRFGDAANNASNFRFIIEIAPEDSSNDGGFLSGFMGGADPVLSNKGKEVIGANLHARSRISLKIYDPQDYQGKVLTVMQPNTYWGSAYGERLRVKADRRKQELDDAQNFIVSREGSLTWHLTLDEYSRGSAQGQSGAAGVTSDEKIYQTLLEAYMCAISPVGSSFRDSSKFRCAPPAFRSVAQQQVRGAKGQEDGKAKGDAGQLAKMVAAILRCGYLLVEIPKAKEARSYMLDEILGGNDRTEMTPRLIAMAMAVQRLARKDQQELDVTCAWMPSKLLKLLSSCIGNSPTLNAPARSKRGGGEQQRNEQRAKEQGVHDQARVFFTNIVSAYLNEILSPTLLRRLDVVVHQSLDLQEVVLLREFAAIIDNIALNFFSNELRCARESAGELKNASSQAAKALEGAPSPQVPSEHHLNGNGNGNGTHKPVALNEGTRLMIFQALIPDQVINVLVHGLLHALHQENIAFSAGDKSKSDVNVRLLSSLVNRSISALAAVMHGRSRGGEQTECDYFVCEAVSQAMSNADQVVPRARVSQLMHERAIDRVRDLLQGMLDDGEMDLGLPRSASPRPGERVAAIAYAWAGEVRSDAPLIIPLRLLAITSRSNLVSIDVWTGENGDMTEPVPSRDKLTVVAFRELAQLKKFTVHRRMRQFLGLRWSSGESEVVLFENSWRCRQFQQALKLVERERRSGQEVVQGKAQSRTATDRRGVPEAFVPKQVMTPLLEACRIDRSGASIVNVSFVRRADVKDAFQVQMELIVLTLDTIAVVALESFMKQYSQCTESHFEIEELPDGNYEETDSEGDDLPPSGLGGAQAMAEDLGKIETLRGPWQMKHLQGVRFHPDLPQVRLEFGGTTEEVTFASDGDRQRFRRHLANVGTSKGPGWSVLATDKVTIDEVKRLVKGRTDELPPLHM